MATTATERKARRELNEARAILQEVLCCLSVTRRKIADGEGFSDDDRAGLTELSTTVTAWLRSQAAQEA